MVLIHCAGRGRPASWRGAVAWCAWVPFCAAAQVSPPPLGLSEALQIATAQSQRIVATESQSQAARASAAAAAQRPDPVLKFGLNNLPIDGADRFSLTRDFMTMRSVALMQELPSAAKRAARANRAQREVEASQLATRQALAELQRDTALAWFERSFQESLRDLQREQVREAELQVQAAQALASNSKASPGDLLSARTQLEQARDTLAQGERAVDVATTRLARWIGDAATRRSDTRPELTAPAWTTSADLEVHLARHVELAALAQQEAIAHADVQLAQAEQRPDWSIELMFSQRGPAYSNMVSINASLPLQWNRPQRQGREIAAREALAARSSAEREDRQRAHAADVRAMLQQWSGHEQRLQRFDAQLIPLAQQRGAAALSAYRAGSGTLGAVLDARRAEVDARIERLRVEVELARLWAQLNTLEPMAAADSARSAP